MKLSSFKKTAVAGIVAAACATVPFTSTANDPNRAT